MSDIFAAFCSAQVGGVWEMTDHVWNLAEGIILPVSSGNALRYMGNPTLDAVSSDYYPERWTGSADNGGVHFNSGISNLAFKLLSTGGTHPRNKTPAITVSGIGIEKAGRIFYEANINWFTSSTTFSEAKVYTEQAAQALGYDAATQQSVADAWLAVGVSSGILGHLDGLSPRYGLEGWAYDRHSPSDSLSIHYYIDNSNGTGAVFSGYTNILRTDVNNAFGLPASSTHGFVLPIPEQYYDGVEHTLDIYAIDVQGVDNPLIDNTQRTFTFAGAEGNVNEITSAGDVRGWALDLQSPSTSIAVHYYIGGPAGSGAPAFAVPTDQFRSDVNSEYGASGNHGFSFRIPSQFHDGVSRYIYLYAIDAQGRHNPLIDGHPYIFTVGTIPPPTNPCGSGKIYCSCTDTCTTRATCDKLCD